MNKQAPASNIRQLRGRLQTAEAFASQALKGAKQEEPLYEATRRLLGVHREMQCLLSNEGFTQADRGADDEFDIVHAAIEIEREEHMLKPDLKDILKAFFMWKDDPEERARQRSA